MSKIDVIKGLVKSMSSTLNDNGYTVTVDLVDEIPVSLTVVKNSIYIGIIDIGTYDDKLSKINETLLSVKMTWGEHSSKPEMVITLCRMYDGYDYEVDRYNLAYYY